MAHEAFEAPRRLGRRRVTRGRTLQTGSPQLLWECKEEMARLEAIGAGHPIGDARWEADAAARTFEYYAGAVDKHVGLERSRCPTRASTWCCASRSACAP